MSAYSDLLAELGYTPGDRAYDLFLAALQSGFGKTAHEKPITLHDSSGFVAGYDAADLADAVAAAGALASATNPVLITAGPGVTKSTDDLPEYVSIVYAEDVESPSAIGYELSTGGISPAADRFRGDGTALDWPVPRPRYSSVPVVSIVVDDANSTWNDASRFVGVLGGGKSPRQYLLDNRVPFSWGPYPANVGVSSALSAAELQGLLKIGGEICMHTYTHRADHAGMPAGTNPDYYETVAARDWLETNVKWPVRGSLWAGVTDHADKYDINRCYPDCRRSRLIRANFLAHREWTYHATNYPQGQREFPAGVLPMQGRMPATNTVYLTNVFSGLSNVAADEALAIERLLYQLAYSKAQAVNLWFHGIRTDGSAATSSADCQVTVFKQLVDTLKALMDARLINVVPFTQMYYTYPCASGEEPNLIRNPGFEYRQGADGVALSAESVPALHSYYIITGDAGSTIKILAAANRSGDNGLEMVRVAGTGACSFQFQTVPLVPGEQYTLSWWQSATSGSPTISATVYMKDKDAATISHGTANVSGAASGVGDGWVYRHGRFSVPIGTTYAVVVFAMGVSDTQLYLDDLFLG